MRIFNVGFIVLFMTMLIIPLVCIDLASGRASVEENRMLANPPELADIKNHPGTFIRHFDSWLKDSTGFREHLMALYNDYNTNTWLNGILYRNGQYSYLVGEQGHYYFAYTDGWMISKFRGKQFVSDERLQTMADKLEDVRVYLDRKSIPFVVMFCTDKETIYPEYYPKSIKPGPEPVQLDVITGYLQEHTGVDIFNIREALLKGKETFLMYPVSSSDLTHYNETGAFFAYRELMKHINRYFPEIVPYELSDLNITGDVIEGSPIVSLKTETTYKQLDASFFNDIDGVRPFASREDRVYENTKSESPIMLLMCDSYAAEHFIGKFLNQQFSKVICIHFQNIENIYEYIFHYKPDIVVFESAERELDSFAHSVAMIPELLPKE